MKYRYFLFDWDGSLGNTLPMWFWSFQETFLEYGIEATYSDIGREVIGDWEGPAKLGINNLEEFFGKVERRILPALPQTKLNPGVEEMIGEIKKAGGKIGILTTSKRIWVEPALKNLGIMDKVDIFLGKEDVEMFKPDPEIIYKSENLLRGDKSEYVMTGDTVKDVLAAKNAGIESILYFPKRYEVFYDKASQESLPATYLIRDFAEFKNFL